MRGSGSSSWPIFFTKSTRKSAANGCRSCGSATASYIIALAVLIVAGIGGWRGYQWWRDKQAAAAGAKFEAALTLSEAGQARARRKPPSPRSPPRRRPAIATLARFRAAAELAQAKPAEAVKAYDKLAADTSLERRPCAISPICAPACCWSTARRLPT